jgi:hypothetical protein
MRDRWSFAMGTLAALSVVLACLGPAVPEGGQLIATVGRPALVTAVAGATPEARPADQTARLIISVMAFRPPQDGTVQAVVEVQRNGSGTELEIGRFGVFPNAEFRAAEPSKAQRFGFPLPKDLAGRGPLKLKIRLLPVGGEGKDAQLEIGGAEIR